MSTGFHAPSLQQQFFQSTATNFIVTPQGNLPFDIVTFRVTNPAAIALGAEPLKPEESTNYSLGLVLQPIERLYITIDAYRIEVDDRIIAVGEPHQSRRYANYLNANGFVGVGGGRYFTNAIDTTTNGIDVVGTYRWELGSGKLDLTAGYNYNKTEIDRIAPNPPALTRDRSHRSALRPGRDRSLRSRCAARQVPARRPLDIRPLAAFAPMPPATASSSVRNATIRRRTRPSMPKWTLDLAATFKLDGWRLHPRRRQRARRVSRREYLRQLHQRPAAVREQCVAVRLQRRVRLRPDRLPLVARSKPPRQGRGGCVLRRISDAMFTLPRSMTDPTRLTCRDQVPISSG